MGWKSAVMWLFLAEESEFSGGAVGAEVVGKMEGGSGAGGDGRIGAESAEGKEAGGLVEAKAGSELAGGSAENAAAQGGVEGAEAVEFDGDGGLARSGADGAAAATDGLAGKEDLWEEASEFGLPARFFFAG
jgi:hypothetical protein